jgi:hypothetical protein
VIATNTAGGQVQRFEARHRVHARVEGFIRCGKSTGLGRWPPSSFAINTAWITAAAIAIDLLCWMRLLLLDGPLAKAEPATLRHRLLRTAVRLISHSAYLILRVCRTWPWAQEFRRGFQPRPGHPLTSGPLTQQPQEGASHHQAGGTRRHRTTRRRRLARSPEIKITEPHPLTSREHSHPGEISRSGIRGHLDASRRPSGHARA